MKKIFALCALMLALSLSTFAGGIPIGGRTDCPNGQTTCLVTTEYTEPKDANFPERVEEETTVYGVLSDVFSAIGDLLF